MLVTGTSKRIGLSIATILAQASARVAVSEANTVAKASICHPVMRLARARGNFAQMSKCTVAARHYCGVVGILPARTKTKRKPVIMKYALLVHGSQEYFDRGKDAAYIAAGMAYGETLRAAGIFVGGAGLQSPQTATTVSVRDGKRQVHDGPYAETKEQIGGYDVIECASLGAAMEVAAAHPIARTGTVEVRPLGDFPGDQ